jgi:hypothetical protein
LSLPDNLPLALRFFSAFCLIGLSALVASPASARDSIGFNAAPAWVQHATIPSEDAGLVAQAQDGVFYLMSDAQTRIEAEVYTHSRWHGHAFGMLAVGALVWGLAAYGLTMPE